MRLFSSGLWVRNRAKKKSAKMQYGLKRYSEYAQNASISAVRFHPM